MHLAIRILITVAIVAFANPGTAVSECPTISTESLEIHTYPDEAQLVEMLNALLLAHCICEFPNPLAQHLTDGIGYGFESVESLFGGPPICLGRLDVREIEIDSELPIGAIEVRTTKEPIQDLIIVFSLTDDGWFCSWPELI